MRILLLILLFIIIYPIVKVWLMMRRARRRAENAMRTARRADAREQRRYGDVVSEDAEFEEVRTSTNDAAETSSHSNETYREEQVVDAEFEEIP